MWPTHTRGHKLVDLLYIYIYNLLQQQQKVQTITNLNSLF
jgi:hypothetical protein